MARDAEELAAQAERLRALKKQARVTFHQIAESVGVTERQAQRWMSDSDEDRSGIDPANLKKLARYLGTTQDYIEYGTMSRKNAGTPDLSLIHDGDQAQLDRIEAKLNELIRLRDSALQAFTNQIEDLRADLRRELAIHVVEELRRIEEAGRPAQEPPGRQQQ